MKKEPAPNQSDSEQLKAMKVLVVPALAVYGAIHLWSDIGGPRLLDFIGARANLTPAEWMAAVLLSWLLIFLLWFTVQVIRDRAKGET